MDRLGSSRRQRMRAGRGTAPGETIDFFLTDRRAFVTVFQNLGKAGSPFHARRDGACDSMRNEKRVKPLKTNNSVKWSISHPQ
jgi:hypothetical protein